MIETTRGRFGITRDADGSLSSLYEWPWYWRYPLALMGCCVSLAAAVYLTIEHRPNWMALSVACVGSLASLSMAYEAFALAIFVGIIGGAAYAVSGMVGFFFPSSGNWHISWQMVVLVFACIYLYAEMKALRVRVEQLEASNTTLHDRLNAIQHPQGW